MNFSLRTKLLIPTFLIFATGMVAAFFFAHMNSTMVLKEEVAGGIRREVDLTVKHMDRWMGARKKDIYTWSLQELYREALTEKGYYGKSARRGASETLRSLQEGYPYYHELFLCSNTGDLVASSTGIHETQTINSTPHNFSDRLYFKSAKYDKTYVSEIIKSRLSGKEVFVVSVPVKKDGRVVGVLAGAILLDSFSSLFVDDFTNAYLLDRRGKMIAGSRRNGGFLDEGPEESRTKQILARPSGQIISEVHGRMEITCFQKLSSPDWIFVENQSLDKAYASLKRLVRYSIIAGILIFISTSIFTTLIYRRMIDQRLMKILQVIGLVERGDYGAKINDPVKSDEIGAVTAAIDNMTGKMSSTLHSLKGEMKIRLNTEKELEEHKNNLEILVKKRTQELEKEIQDRQFAQEANKKLETRLHQAEKMEAIGTLAGGIAHDLNNILSGILSYPELLLLKMPKDSPMRRPVETIQSSGKKASVIVQDLLTLARRGVTITEVTNLNPIIEDYLESPEYTKLLSYHPEVSVKTNLHPELMPVSGSPVHLAKTIMNLVSNAAEAITQDGTISIETHNVNLKKPVTGFETIPCGHYTLLSVKDSGIGMGQTEIKRIFEPFYTRKKMGRSGTGLGMAVVWGTIKDHKGYVNVESRLGSGTTFSLYFPVTSEEKPERDTGFTLADYLGNGETILVVDDVPEQRVIASEILTELGYHAVSVECGEDAITYIKKHKVDLLILDMIMGSGMDGLDTYRRINSIHPVQKAIITSGFSETDRIREAMRIGAGKYLKKPYHLESMARAVKAELAR